MLEVQNLSKSFYGTKAVDDITFRVESGEILGFLGPNGAGKTTTMRMITASCRRRPERFPSTASTWRRGLSRPSATSATFPRRWPSTRRCASPST